MSPNKSSEVDESSENEKEPPILCTERWRLAMLAFVGFFFVYALRVDMSVAIVCMVKTAAQNSSTTMDNDTDTCGMTSEKSVDSDRGEFDWDKGVQSSVLSSFFYGYLVMQIPGGWLAGRFGGRRVLGGGLAVVALATVLLPTLARVDFRFVYALRVIMGVASSVSFPAMHAMWGRWAPPAERSRLASFSYTGLMLGNIVTFIGSGYLCAHGFDNGWASIFYVFGGACFLWLLLWWLLAADSPDSSTRITAAERKYITSSIGDHSHAEYSVPWLAILRSRACWVVLVAHVCNNWMHYTLVTSLPTFMKEVLKFDIEQNGVLSAVPYAAMAVAATCGGHLADWLRRTCLSTRTTRRLFQATSFLGGGACLVAVGFLDCSRRELAVALLAVAVGFEGLCYSGYVVNHIDFAPRYAGVLMGISNTVATIPGVVAPEVAGALTPNRTQAEWRNVFYVCGAFCLLGAAVFGSLAVTDPEPWAHDTQDTESSDDDRDKHNANNNDAGTGKTNKGYQHEKNILDIIDNPAKL